MNANFIGVLSIIISVMVLCIQAVIDNTPALPAIGLVLACLILGYLLGENSHHE